MSTSPTAAAEHAATSASRSAASRIQTKLAVGRSHDAYEQEADRVANVVVARGTTPAVRSAAAAPGAQRRAVPTISRLRDQAARRQLQRQEEEPQEKLQRQEEEEPQEKLQRQEEEEPQEKLQRQEEEEPQEKLQRQEEEEPQEKLQRQEEEEPQGKLQRQEEEVPQEKLQRKGEEKEKEEEEEEKKESVQRKKEPRANVRDKRQFPVLDRVEGKLFESKGRGEPLPDATRVEMEGGFRADFSGVRIHTGGEAEAMSRELRAQAFTHGKDVFFNAGKFEPDTVRGKTLLAHELTHVVQQGAAEQRVPEEAIDRNNAARNQPPPEPADKEAGKAERASEERLERSEPELGEKPAAPPAEAAGEAAAPAEARAPAAGEEAPEAEEKKAEAEKAPPKKAKKAAKRGAKKAKTAAMEGKGGAVGEFLRRSTRAVFQAKKAGVAQLAANEKKKEPAEAKLAQTEKAVVPPAQEGASKSKAGQVESVERSPEPQPDEAKAREEFDAALDNAVPRTLEEVDEFKEKGKGRVVGQVAREVVTADAQEVKGTYREIDNPPAPEPPEREPEELPEIEAAPETEALDPGDGVVGEVRPEHTDLSAFDKESDSLLEKEEIQEEHLEMVDEGDLAEANKERKTLKTTVKEGPREVKLLEQQEKQKVKKDLQKEELDGRQKMRDERRQELQGARGEQQKTKSKIELKRQEVTDRINAIYETANTTVKQKLDDLEKSSLKAFDDGERAATKSFEDNVKRRIDAFKKRRYDRWGGSLLWAKDKLFGMDDLPEVKEIFDSEKSRFVTAVDALIKKITAESQRVVQECKDVVANARKEIEEYVAGLGPELKKTGQDALKEMKGKLDALDKKVDAKEKELQKKLAAKREAAIKAIEEKIEKMKEEMSGLVSKLGNLLLNAMLKFFTWALKKAGFSPDKLMSIIDKGKAAVIKKIVTDPIGFIKNLVKGVRDGIDLFVKNIKKHLISGLIGWLTGAMADVPITLPSKWDLKGILHLVLQILGLTWDRIRKKLVKRLGEKVVKIAETSVDILKRLITEGPIALWEMIKTKAAEIKEKVMEGIRNWVITQVVKQAIIKLVSFLNPAGAIIQAILAIYNTIMFFVENWRRIVDFVKSVFDSIGDIAMGKLSKAAQAVERAMAMTIPIILSFLARLIGLSGIGKAVANVIEKIRRPIDKIVEKVIDGVVKMAKKLLSKAKKAGKTVAKKGKEAVKKLLAWWKLKKSFKAKDGKTHEILFGGSRKKRRVIIRSDETDLEKWISENKSTASPEVKVLIEDFGKLKAKMDASEEAYTKLEKSSPKQSNVAIDTTKKLQKDLETAMISLTKHLPLEFFQGSQKVPPSAVTFKMEKGNPTRVIGKPLSKLSGNTKGESAEKARSAQQPLGRDTATIFTSKGQKIRDEIKQYESLAKGEVTPELTKKYDKNLLKKLQYEQINNVHLVSDRLHGPAKRWNFALANNDVNNRLRSIEHSADEFVGPADNKKAPGVLEYVVDVGYHSPNTNSEVRAEDFPQTITVTTKWGKLGPKADSVSYLKGDPPASENLSVKKGLFDGLQVTGIRAPAGEVDKGDLVKGIKDRIDTIYDRTPWASDWDRFKKVFLKIHKISTAIGEDGMKELKAHFDTKMWYPLARRGQLLRDLYLTFGAGPIDSAKDKARLKGLNSQWKSSAQIFQSMGLVQGDPGSGEFKLSGEGLRVAKLIEAEYKGKPVPQLG